MELERNIGSVLSTMKGESGQWIQEDRDILFWRRVASFLIGSKKLEWIALGAVLLFYVVCGAIRSSTTAISGCGVCVWVLAAICLSKDSRSIRPLALIPIVVIHGVIAFCLCEIGAMTRLLKYCAASVARCLESSFAGSQFVFGSLGIKGGEGTIGFVFAFQVLPGIIFATTLFEVLRYWGLLRVITAIAEPRLCRVFSVTPREAIGLISCVIFGMVEGPVIIRTELSGMQDGELFTLMAASMASVSAATLEAYILVGHADMQYLLLSVVLAAPAAIIMSRIMVPTIDAGSNSAKAESPRIDHHPSLMAALSFGSQQGARLAVSVGASLIAFLSLLHCCDWILSIWGLSVEGLFGWCFYVAASLLGVTKTQVYPIAQVLGLRIATNEVVAFAKLATVIPNGQRGFVLTTIAICGFANLSSMAVLSSAWRVLVPERRHTVDSFVWRALVAGVLADMMSACVVGVMLR